MCTRPALAAKQNGHLFSLHPHPRFATLFFFWLREPWDFPDVVAVDRSDMGSSFSGLYTILRPSPARVETPETARTYCVWSSKVGLKTHGPPLAETGLLGSGIKCTCGRSKDPSSAFGGNWAAWQRNQVRLWRNWGCMKASSCCIPEQIRKLLKL